ncbi:hypothetical protein A6R68_22897, partial [Neotoma lepida]
MVATSSGTTETRQTWTPRERSVRHRKPGLSTCPLTASSHCAPLRLRNLSNTHLKDLISNNDDARRHTASRRK